MAKDEYCPRCSRMHDPLLMECPSSSEARCPSCHWHSGSHSQGCYVEQLTAARLQIDALKKALYEECRGIGCTPGTDECAGGGYRGCTGCEKRAKAAFGPGWGPVLDKKEGA
jgi:hypothetical protein